MGLLDAALGYALQGWHVFPLEPGGKRPITPRGHHDASTDPDTIRAWWRFRPSANIGIALAPSGLVVLDVDVNGGKQGLVSLQSLKGIPRTRVARTGRGGWHLYFARPDGLEPRRVIGFKPGLDLLGEGYVVAPPSVLTDGQGYAWT